MNDSSKIINLYFQSIKRFGDLESMPRNFGTDDLLYSSEINTVQAIGNNPNINLTLLAERLGISKSGASKFTGKLLEKGLITKNKLIDNDKEVVFNLTKLGYTAYAEHDAFSKSTFQAIYNILDQLDGDQTAFLESFLEDLNEAVSQIIQ